MNAYRTLPVPRYHLNGGDELSDANRRDDDSQAPAVDETAIAEAAAAWDAVEHLEPVEGRTPVTSKTTESVTFLDAWAHCRARARPVEPQPLESGCCLRQLVSRMTGPPTLRGNRDDERALILGTAATPFDNNDAVHVRMLMSMYKALTRSKWDCPRFGAHWEEIGFQGNDPATDLRSMGVLGLLMGLFLVTRQHSLAHAAYALSHHATQNFPFCAMAINVGAIALRALRDGKLNRVLNHVPEEEAIQTVCQLFAGGILVLYRVWKDGKKRISDSAFVLRDVEQAIMNEPERVLADLQRFEEHGLESAQPAKRSAAADADELAFSDICGTDKFVVESDTRLV